MCVLYVCCGVVVLWSCGDVVEGVRRVLSVWVWGPHVLRPDQENTCLSESLSTFLP